MKLLLTLSFIIFTGSVFAQNNDTLQQVKYSKGNYTIDYPSNWQLNTPTSRGIEFIIFSPLENTQDKFSENINLIIQDLKGKNIDLEKYTQISEVQIKANAKDLADFSAIKIKTALNEYYKVTYEMTYNNCKLNTEQFYFIKNEKAYVITFSSEAGKEKIVGQKILASFALVN